MTLLSEGHKSQGRRGPSIFFFRHRRRWSGGAESCQGRRSLAFISTLGSAPRHFKIERLTPSVIGDRPSHPISKSQKKRRKSMLTTVLGQLRTPACKAWSPTFGIMLPILALDCDMTCLEGVKLYLGSESTLLRAWLRPGSNSAPNSTAGIIVRRNVR
jgi:hypothetical protein